MTARRGLGASGRPDPVVPGGAQFAAGLTEMSNRVSLAPVSGRLAALAALAILLVACNGDDTAPTVDDDTLPPDVSPTTTAAPATSPPDEATSTTAVPSPATTTTTPGGPATATTTTPASTTTTTPPATISIDQLELRLEVVAEGFRQPVLVTAPPGDRRLFVVDQPGRIWVVEDDTIHEFLDIRNGVRFQGEQGLLGLAFHPGYAENGLFYLDFINRGGNTVLAEFRADPPDSNRADPVSRRDVLTVAQPAGNHNGGMIAFGPEGLLWFGLGDGGGANDQFGNGQRADRRLASMIRIEVGPDAPEPYGDPDGSPFRDDGGLPEVWSIGLRNPWRWAFDEDDLYIADVGQNAIEEVNVVPLDRGGLNFGWPILEGDECFRSSNCDRSGLQGPVLTYTHAVGCSVTGGFVYRGRDIPELAGHYFFGDFCGGWVDSIVVGSGREVVSRHSWFPAGTVPNLTSFGVDAEGEVYVMSQRGTVYRIARG